MYVIKYIIEKNKKSIIMRFIPPGLDYIVHVTNPSFLWSDQTVQWNKTQDSLVYDNIDSSQYYRLCYEEALLVFFSK